MRASFHLHVIHDERLSVRCLSLRVCPSPVSLRRLTLLLHTLPALCPALHLQCQQRRRETVAKAELTASYRQVRKHVCDQRVRQRKTEETYVPRGALEGLLRPADLGTQSLEESCHGGRDRRWARFATGGLWQRSRRQACGEGRITKYAVPTAEDTFAEDFGSLDITGGHVFTDGSGGTETKDPRFRRCGCGVASCCA